MLTNDQCIKVAELWGMPLNEAKYKSKVLVRGMVASDFNPIDGTYKFATVLQSEVHSWRGFGRTVEAMAGDFHFGSYILFVWFERKGRDGYYSAPLFSKNFEADDFWQATHLAALKARNK